MTFSYIYREAYKDEVKWYLWEEIGIKETQHEKTAITCVEVKKLPVVFCRTRYFPNWDMDDATGDDLASLWLDKFPINARSCRIFESNS